MALSPAAQELLDISESGDVEAFLARLGDDLVWHGSQDFGKPEMSAFFRAYYTAFPEIRYDWTDEWEEGDRFGATQHLTATHTGVLDLRPFLDVVVPTGRTIQMPATHYEVRHRDGMVIGVFDSSQGAGLPMLLQQLGVDLPG